MKLTATLFFQRASPCRTSSWGTQPGRTGARAAVTTAPPAVTSSVTSRPGTSRGTTYVSFATRAWPPSTTCRGTSTKWVHYKSKDRERIANISSLLSCYRITKPRPIVRRPRSAVGSYRERSKNCRETQSFLPSTSQPHSTTHESRDRSIKGLGENWYSPAFPNRWAIKYPRRQNGEQIERLRWRFIIVTKTRDFVRNQVRVKMAYFSLLAGITRSL